jgi:hypothetical protein
MKTLVKNRIKIFILAGIFTILPFQSALASDITPNRVIQLVNEDRRKNGSALFSENKLLDIAAQEKVDDMIAHNYFLHTSPMGVTPWYWFDQVKYDYVHAGENLAINFESAEVEQEAWMKSPTHRKNILNANYQEIGVAVRRGVIDGQEGTVVVQFFGSQKFPNGSIYQKVSSGMTKNIAIQSSAAIAPRIAGTEMLKPFDKNIYKPYSMFTAFSYALRNEFFSGEKNTEKAAWFLAMIVIFALTVFNAVVLSRKNYHNPFAAANSVVFMIMFATLLFWGL